MKQCNFCGNKNLSSRKVQYIYRHDGNYLFVDHVPCLQCDYCGEQYFEASVLKKIESDFQAIHYADKKASRQITIPYEDFVLA